MTKSDTSDASLRPQFDEVLLDSVDRVLRMIFGDSAARTIYQHLETHKQLRRQEIPIRIGDFSLGLSQLLGSSSGHMLEKLVTKQLCSRLELEHNPPQDFKFEAYLQELKDAAKEIVRLPRG